jgi:hypothetical protein
VVSIGRRQSAPLLAVMQSPTPTLEADDLSVMQKALFRGARYSESRISREVRRDDLVGIIVA